MPGPVSMRRWAWITRWRGLKDRISMRWHGTCRCQLCGSIISLGETCCRYV